MVTAFTRCQVTLELARAISSHPTSLSQLVGLAASAHDGDMAEWATRILRAAALQASSFALQGHISASAIAVVMKALKGSLVGRLDFIKTSIGDEGGKAIGEGLAGSQLTTLYLGGNSIGDEALAIVEAGLARNRA